MNLTTLLKKLQEHKMELKRLDEDEGDNKKKSITLKVRRKYSDFDEDLTILVRNFKRFMNHDKQQNFQHKNKGRSSCVPTCYQCEKEKAYKTKLFS